MTRQAVTATVAAVGIVGLSIILALVGIPFVAYSPGQTVDVLGSSNNGDPIINVSGVPTYPVTGELRMTTVSVTRVDSQLNIFEAIAAHLLPNRDVLPRDTVYPPGRSNEQVREEERGQMSSSQRNSIVAAMRAADQTVTALPMVSSVSISGPSYEKLRPGDLIVEVDSQEVQSIEDILEIIQAKNVGDSIRFQVLRDGEQVIQNIETVSSNSGGATPVIGASLTIGYQYSADVNFSFDADIVGPSAGLIFSLGIFDKITEQDIIGGRAIAGTGAIQPDGKVLSIGGIKEKIAAAERDGAEIFLFPKGNCDQVMNVDADITLVPVSELPDAINALKRGSDEELPSKDAICQ